MGIMIGQRDQWTPPVRCARKWPRPCDLMAAPWIMKNAMIASPAVTFRFPVADAPYGISPIRFISRMKKNVVRRYGIYRRPPGPMFATAISSRTNTIIASIMLLKPDGTSRRRTLRDTSVADTMRSTAASQRKTTCFVIDRSSVTPPICTGGN